MSIIIRSITNLTPYTLTLKVPSLEQNLTPVTISPSQTLDLLSVVTEDDLIAMQLYLQGMVDRGNVSVAATFDTDTLEQGYNGGGGSGGANTSLSNLTSPTALNQDIIPSSDGHFNLGSSSKQFSVVYAYNVNSIEDDLDLSSNFNVFITSGSGSNIVLNPQTGVAIVEGKLGIGQPNPQAQLHVTGGGVQVGDPGNDQSITFGGTNAGLYWSTSGASITYNTGSLFLSAVGASNALQIIENTGEITINSGILNLTGSSYRLIGDTGSQALRIYVNGANPLNIQNGIVGITTGGELKWSNDGFGSSYDTGLHRVSAGLLEVNNGTPGTLADLNAHDIDASGTLSSMGLVQAGLGFRLTSFGAYVGIASSNSQWVFNSTDVSILSSVGCGTASPDASAQLDITSTNKGFLPPRMTSTEKIAISSPAEGLIVYDTDNHAPYFWNGSSWIAF